MKQDDRPLDPAVDPAVDPAADPAADPDARVESVSTYLWDGSGSPDADVERLETLLAPLAHNAPMDELRARRPSHSRRVILIGAAAAILAGAAGLAVWWQRSPVSTQAMRCTSASATTPGWQVTSLAGAPRCGGEHLTAAAGLPVGTWLETDARSRAKVSVADIGTVEVAEESRLRVLASHPEEHRLELVRGSIHATVDAPPRLFFVETPSAVAVDLGCEYTLTVDEHGGSVLAVSYGFVSLEHGGRESFVPTGARCDTRPGKGPGTPYAGTASKELREALAAYDFAGGGTERLDRVLALCGRGDTVTMWNLLARAPSSDERSRIYDRLAHFVLPPASIRRVLLLDGDHQALLDWRSSLEELWMGEEEWDHWTDPEGTE